MLKVREDKKTGIKAQLEITHFERARQSFSICPSENKDRARDQVFGDQGVHCLVANNQEANDQIFIAKYK